MAKHTTKAAATEGKPRPAPYTKSKETSANSSKGKGKSKPAAASTGNNTKARVEVRYEGAGPSTGSSSGKTTQKQTPGVVEVKAEPTEVDSTSAATPSTSAAASSSKPTPAARAPTTITQDSFVVIAGSYEKLLYGIEGTYPLPDPSADRKAGHNKDDGPERPTTRPVFIFPAHLAYVKCIAASPGGKWLATGSEDEFIKVWDLRRRKEVGSLSQHSGMSACSHNVRRVAVCGLEDTKVGTGVLWGFNGGLVFLLLHCHLPDSQRVCCLRAAQSFGGRGGTSQRYTGVSVPEVLALIIQQSY